MNLRTMMPNDIISDITQNMLPATQYERTVKIKTQIYVHHTASNPDPFAVDKWWASNAEKVAVAFVVGGKSNITSRWKNGQIVQDFSTQYWAWHLGLTGQHLLAGGANHKTNTQLNKNSIGIEICNWGPLTLKSDGKFYSYINIEIPQDEVIEFSKPFRGYQYYHKYTSEQIDSVQKLLQYLTEKFSIPSQYQGDRIFDICPDALCGVPGIYTHVSVRPDKTDCSPQPELISMLKTL